MKNIYGVMAITLIVIVMFVLTMTNALPEEPDDGMFLLVLTFFDSDGQPYGRTTIYGLDKETCLRKMVELANEHDDDKDEGTSGMCMPLGDAVDEPIGERI